MRSSLDASITAAAAGIGGPQVRVRPNASISTCPFLRRWSGLSGHQLWFRMLEIAEDLDQAEALAHQHHVLTESSTSEEVGPMRTTPVGQAPITFALIICKGCVDFIE